MIGHAPLKVICEFLSVHHLGRMEWYLLSLEHQVLKHNIKLYLINIKLICNHKSEWHAENCKINVAQGITC